MNAKINMQQVNTIKHGTEVSHQLVSISDQYLETLQVSHFLQDALVAIFESQTQLSETSITGIQSS